jgi:hypothetical protein
LFAWLQGSWYHQTIWTQGFVQQRRNVFVFHFQSKASASSRVSVLPILLVAPCVKLPGDEQACDEAFRAAKEPEKHMIYAYANLINSNEAAHRLQSQQCHLSCSYFSIALDSLVNRTCLITLRFAASLEKRHAASSEVTMTFRVSYVGDLASSSLKSSKDNNAEASHLGRWRVAGLERIPDSDYKTFLSAKWGFEQFQLQQPQPGKWKDRY